MATARTAMTVDRPAASEDGLRRDIGLVGGTAVAVSIVVGSGLLVLPGVVYEQHGSSSLYVWLLDALIVVPLLAVFVWLGRRYPGSGGVAGYVRRAFGAQAGTVVTVVALGTLVPGLSTVAVAGGYHAQALLDAGRVVAVAGSIGLLAAAVAVNLLGVSVSSRAQVVATAVFVSAIVVVAVGALVVARPGPGRQILAGPGEIPSALPALASVFFAFTGWEMVSFTTGEFRDARRHFPVVVWASYLVVLVLYVLLAFSVQYALQPDSTGVGTAPIAELAALVAGSTGRRLFSLVGVVLVFANLIGAVWAVSRLVYASALSSLLPPALGRLQPQRRVPARAVLLSGTALATLAAVTATGALHIATLFAVAGQSFLVLYLACLLAYLRLVDGPISRVMGVLAAAPCMLMVGSLGWHSLYPLALLGTGVWAAWRRPEADLAAAEQHAVGLDPPSIEEDAQAGRL